MEFIVSDYGKSELRSLTGVPFSELVAIFALNSVKGFGPMKFHAIHEAGLTCLEVLNSPGMLPGKGKRIDQLKIAIAEQTDINWQKSSDIAEKQLIEANKYNAKILTYHHSDYPKNVYKSNNPIPLLYARGNTSVLRISRAVACVGSRKIRPPYNQLLENFATHACEESFVIASGFALGADTIGHQTAYNSLGKTICVMPGGLQRMFPPENQALWNSLLDYSGAVFISEFPFGSRASAINLRKRNKLIVACVLGVLISQSSKTGGAMNAYRFAIEQKKPIATFRADESSDIDSAESTSGNMSIEKSEKGSIEVFPNNTSGNLEYSKWLSKLSLST